MSQTARESSTTSQVVTQVSTLADKPSAHAAKGTKGALKVSQHFSRQAKSENGSTRVGTGARRGLQVAMKTAHAGPTLTRVISLLEL